LIARSDKSWTDFASCSLTHLRDSHLSGAVWTLRCGKFTPLCSTGLTALISLSWEEPCVRQCLSKGSSIGSLQELRVQSPLSVLMQANSFVGEYAFQAITDGIVTLGVLGVFSSSQTHLNEFSSPNYLKKMVQQCLLCLSSRTLTRVLPPVRPNDPSRAADTHHQLPKGFDFLTLNLIWKALREAGRATATDIANRLSLSTVSARKYLALLTEAGLLNVGREYGGPGRPPSIYEVTSLGTELDDLGGYVFQR